LQVVDVEFSLRLYPLRLSFDAALITLNTRISVGDSISMDEPVDSEKTGSYSASWLMEGLARAI